MNMIKETTNGKNNLRILVAAILMIVIVIQSLGWGRFTISWGEIMKITGGLIFARDSIDFTSPEVSVFFYIRLPRILLALLVGATLAIAGSLFQGIFKNPLASPDILGVASGCSFGAAFAIVMIPPFPYKVQLFSLLFGVISIVLVYLLARFSKGDKLIMLVLIGTIISALFGAALSFLQYIADPVEELGAIVYWLMGGLHRATWNQVLPLLFFLIPCFILLMLLSWKINILSLGEEEAKSLGVNVNRIRIVLIGITTVMISACISITGSIGWVGLVIPHIARIFVGADHRFSVPMSMLVGGSFLLLMDDAARTLTEMEIPVGILTAFIGAPFFAYLLVRGRGRVWN